MNEPENPQTPPPTPPEQAPPTPPAAPPAGGGREEKFQRRPGRGPRPPKPPGKVQHLAPEQLYEAANTGPRLKDLDAEIDQELQEALSGFTDEVYGEPSGRNRKPETPPGTAPGRLIAKVIRVHGPDVFLDVPGGRSGGFLPMTQFPEGPPAPGTEVEISIEGYDDANGLLILTRKGVAVEADWSTVAPGMIVEARVTATNKGGLSVDVNGIRGFMPISQIDMFRVERPEEYVNQRLVCMVTEVNPEERNLVVSRRALLEQEREEAKEKLWAELAEGQVREGIVRSVREFGAFVDLGGADGLLHVSEMSWQRVQDPASVVQPGQRVKVVVLKIDPEKRKISLGMKQLQASPWDDIESRYHPGTVVTGKVTRTMEFGAFVELEPGVEGLVHISELAPHRVWRASDVVQLGQEVSVMVLNVDKASRRISLSLKQALPREAPKPTAEEEEDEGVPEAPPPRPPRTTPLRGGIGDKQV